MRAHCDQRRSQCADKSTAITTDLLIYSMIVPIIPFRLQSLGYEGVSGLVGWLLFAYVSFPKSLLRTQHPNTEHPSPEHSLYVSDPCICPVCICGQNSSASHSAHRLPLREVQEPQNSLAMRPGSTHRLASAPDGGTHILGHGPRAYRPGH